jgi:hypothetical protein
VITAAQPRVLKRVDSLEAAEEPVAVVPAAAANEEAVRAASEKAA